jgi:hypothetical protein
LGNIRIELNSSGVRELLRSDDVERCCKEKANAVQSFCGDGYETDSYKGLNRVNAMVKATTSKAVMDNLQNNTILKALGAVK